MAASKTSILKLYKTMLRESQGFSSYNFRMYALRRIRDQFKANKTLENAADIDAALADGKKNLLVIKRQALISNLYKTDKLVIESA